eukprot:jgi/Mesen1/3224/ME000187S02391
MCISIWIFDDHEEYALLLALNRDELHSRPTTAAHFWQESPKLLAGRDEEKDGTWLGVTRGGRVAWLTNFRELDADPRAPTRGELTTRFLQSTQSPMEYLNMLAQEQHVYNGYNLIVADLKAREMAYLTNRPKGHATQPQHVPRGLHGLSNALLDTPWPKVKKGKDILKQLLEEHAGAQVPEESMLQLLQDRSEANVTHLPATGVSPELEMKFSPIFVDCDMPQGRYGTRSSAVLAVSHSGQVSFVEKYLEGGVWKDLKIEFMLE